jgi:hypothetical protein
MTVLGLVEGPLWYAAAAIFVVGALWRIGGMLALPARVELSARSAAAGAVRRSSSTLPRPAFVRRTAFHGRGLSVPSRLFALGAPRCVHHGRSSVSWAPMPRWAFIVTAESRLGLILCGCGACSIR